MYMGVLPSVFWNSTLAEIIAMVEGFNKRETNRAKETAEYIYALGVLSGNATGAYNPWNQGKIKIPSIEKIFPALFEVKVEEDDKPKQQDWRIAKANLLKFANAHNKKWGENKK